MGEFGFGKEPKDSFKNAKIILPAYGFEHWGCMHKPRRKKGLKS